MMSKLLNDVLEAVELSELAINEGGWTPFSLFEIRDVLFEHYSNATGGKGCAGEELGIMTQAKAMQYVADQYSITADDLQLVFDLREREEEWAGEEQQVSVEGITNPKAFLQINKQVNSMKQQAELAANIKELLALLARVDQYGVYLGMIRDSKDVDEARLFSDVSNALEAYGITGGDLNWFGNGWPQIVTADDIDELVR